MIKVGTRVKLKKDPQLVYTVAEIVLQEKEDGIHPWVQAVSDELRVRSFVPTTEILEVLE